MFGHPHLEINSVSALLHSYVFYRTPEDNKNDLMAEYLRRATLDHFDPTGACAVERRTGYGERACARVR